MDRCHLKGSEGDAAGYNIRWLLRMIARKGLGLLLCLLSGAGLLAIWQKLNESLNQKPLQGSDQWLILA
jgi:IS5 family transposase